MMLLTDAMETFVRMEKHTADDGYGGQNTTWQDGASFLAAVTFNTSMEARLAEKQGVTSLYTVTTPRNVVLEYHDVFRRVSDGKVFRATSDGDDVATPRSATIDMRQCTAEEYVPVI